MSAGETLALQTLALTRDAVRQLVLAVQEADSDAVEEAEAFLIGNEPTGHGPVSSEKWMRITALQVLHAAATDGAASTGDLDQETDLKTSGWDALDSGDLSKAEAVGRSILNSATDKDDWNYGNLIHDGHILLGYSRLRAGDIPAAASHLRAAGSSAGSPQLDSFGPDLSLAWELMRLGEDDAALGYFKAVSKFWTPHLRD